MRAKGGRFNQVGGGVLEIGFKHPSPHMSGGANVDDIESALTCWCFDLDPGEGVEWRFTRYRIASS